MNLFLPMQLALANVMCAASSPSFLQVQPQRADVLLDRKPTEHLLDHDDESEEMGNRFKHLLDLEDESEEMDDRYIPNAKNKAGHWAGKHEILVWNLCSAKVYSNLGGLGPDSGPHEIRFKALGKVGKKKADLLIVNTTEYHAWNVNRNTARGCFGVINVAHDSEVTLAVSFVEEGTNIPIHMGHGISHYSFSMFDADCSSSGCEEVEMITPQADLEDMCIDEHNELQMAIQEAHDKNHTITEIFTGTHEGQGSDNPPPVGTVQKDRAMSFKLTNSSFRILLRVRRSKQGRNFLFAGATKICKNKRPSKETPVKNTPHACVGGESGQCVIWGDPHIISFDSSARRKQRHPLQEAFFRTRGWKSDQISIYDEGTFWLVKSPRVHIQARYWHNKTNPDWTNLGALAIGGPFLGNNTLVIRSLSRASTWNGEEILSTLYSDFSNEYIMATYRPDAELVKNGKSGPGVELELPDGVSLTVNRWMYTLAAKITMCAQADGQEGQCGNFNGIVKDDIPESTHDFYRAAESEWLF